MRQFQDLGHEVVFLIGDFTGRIGDPSGKSATRPALDDDQIRANADTYREQVFKVLDPDATVVRFNSEWFGPMSAADLVRLASRQTLARMLERDDFARRYAAQRPIALHEFLYPLVQGHDSVALECDVELGGTDQKFNLLMGRELQKAAGQPAQVVMTMPLLEGLDGVNKMSKSLDNYIGVHDAPGEMFGKVMSVDDVLMWRWFDLLSLRPSAELKALRDGVERGANPRDAKVELARELVARFHDAAAAERAHEEFVRRFRQGALPEDLETRPVAVGEAGRPIVNLLVDAGLVDSTSEGRRMVSQGAVRLDGERVGGRPARARAWTGGRAAGGQAPRGAPKARALRADNRSSPGACGHDRAFGPQGADATARNFFAGSVDARFEVPILALLDAARAARRTGDARGKGTKNSTKDG